MPWPSSWGRSVADLSELTEEWQQVLDGTLAFLRTQAATELDYVRCMRVERNAWRLSQSILEDLGIADLEPPPATDELLDQAVRPGPGRQAVTEQVLGSAAGAPVDDGPEGVADDANREVSEEYDAEPLPTVETERPPTPAPAPERDEPATVVPAAQVEPEPVEPEPVVPEEPPPTPDDAATFEGELDLENLDSLPDTLGEEELALEDLGQEPQEEKGPLLPDFDFDDDEEQDETVVFAIGSSPHGEEIAAAMLDENTETAVQVPGIDDDSFDLMPELEEFEELEELDPVDFEDDLDEATVDGVEMPLNSEDFESVDFDEDDIEELEEIDPAPVSMRAAAATRQAAAQVGVGTTPSARVRAGLYGDPNVPTIRDTPQPAPRAAAIKINAKAGTGEMMGFEEQEEPLAIGSAEDYGEDYDDEDDEPSLGGGFSLNVQEYDEDEWEEEEVANDPIPAPKTPQVQTYRGPDPARVAQVLSQAKDAAARGDMQVGIDLFSDVLDMDPDQTDAYVGRGRLYLDLGDYSRAMSDFMTAEDLAPRSPEPQVAIGDLYFARKDYRKAIDYFNGALSMDPNHAMAHCRRGISHYYRKNYSDALQDLQTAESLDSDIPNIATYISMARKKARK